MLIEIICAGFGGQGVLTAGKIIGFASYWNGKNITWFPSYGNEMRGGSANCNVIISDEKIASPYADHPDIVMALNEVSVNTFAPSMKPAGILFVNSSLVNESKEYRKDIRVVKVPVTTLAQSLQNEKAANICMLGAMIRHTELLKKQEFENGMCAYFEQQGKGKYNEKNREALRLGYNYEA